MDEFHHEISSEFGKDFLANPCAILGFTKNIGDYFFMSWPVRANRD